MQFYYVVLLQHLGVGSLPQPSGVSVHLRHHFEIMKPAGLMS